MPRPYDAQIGTYTGTGAAQSVTVGFRPKFVFAFNQTDGDLIWGFFDGMTAATAFTVVAATAVVASQGCTLTSQGFDLGTDATINENAKVYRYVAFA